MYKNSLSKNTRNLKMKDREFKKILKNKNALTSLKQIIKNKIDRRDHSKLTTKARNYR
jgi:hypothetical protein